MAVPTDTFQAYTAIGQREDLSDIIYDISPTDTPFLSNAGRGRATATLHEWQIDALAAAANNAQVEGDDAATDAAAATSRLANQLQISRKTPRVSGTLQAVSTAGRANELSYQIAKRGRELKRDMEVALLGTQAGTAGAAASARQMAGMALWLFDNQIKSGATSTTPAVTAGVPGTSPTAGTTTALTEAQAQSAVALAWTNGGDVALWMVGATNKRVISGFSGIATQFKNTPDSAPTAIIGAADLYVSDFGQHQVVANRFMPVNNVYLLDMEYMEVAYLRDIQQEELSKTGDSDRTMILAEYTLCVHSPASSAKIYTTT